jgi:hypothetical protein
MELKLVLMGASGSGSGPDYQEYKPSSPAKSPTSKVIKKMVFMEASAFSCTRAQRQKVCLFVLVKCNHLFYIFYIFRTTSNIPIVSQEYEEVEYLEEEDKIQNSNAKVFHC